VAIVDIDLDAVHRKLHERPPSTVACARSRTAAELRPHR
jgi:hypothetical protein